MFKWLQPLGVHASHGSIFSYCFLFFTHIIHTCIYYVFGRLCASLHLETKSMNYFRWNMLLAIPVSSSRIWGLLGLQAIIRLARASNVSKTPNPNPMPYRPKP